MPVCDPGAVLQLFRGMEQDAAPKERCQGLDFYFQVWQLAADLNAAGIAEPASFPDQMAKFRFDEYIDKHDVIALELVILHLADFNIAIIDAGAPLNGAEGLGPDLQVKPGSIGRNRRCGGKPLEFAAGGG
ncbi:MAG: hypothetical protein ACD_75C00317G0002 [uncultured bacterium]|nr:MAG: hypothetical protein ACD_75C00317G0002 [uncultured bacterium]